MNRRMNVYITMKSYNVVLDNSKQRTTLLMWKNQLLLTWMMWSGVMLILKKVTGEFSRVMGNFMVVACQNASFYHIQVKLQNNGPYARCAPLVAQLVNNLPAMQEMQVQSLGQEDPLEKEMATHSGILAWEIPWTEEPSELQSIELQRVRHNLVPKPPQSPQCGILLSEIICIVFTRCFFVCLLLFFF